MDRNEKILASRARYQLELLAIEAEYQDEVSAIEEEFNEEVRLLMERMLLDNLERQQRLMELRFGLTGRCSEAKHRMLLRTRNSGSVGGTSQEKGFASEDDKSRDNTGNAGTNRDQNLFPAQARFFSPGQPRPLNNLS